MFQLCPSPDYPVVIELLILARTHADNIALFDAAQSVFRMAVAEYYVLSDVWKVAI